MQSMIYVVIIILCLLLPHLHYSIAFVINVFWYSWQFAAKSALKDGRDPALTTPN